MNTENEEVLYIIGNGFDLSLGLKTSYNDFFEYIDVNRMKKIINLLRKDRENIQNYDNDRLENLLKNLKKYNLKIESKNDYEIDYITSIKRNIEKKSFKELKKNIYSLHKEVFAMLKSKNTFRFVDEYGIFILFLLLTNVEKNEWQWVEKQILNYINDIINICSNNFNEVSSYIKDKWDEIELNLEIYGKLVVKEKDLKTVEEKFYKQINITEEDKLVYKALIEILERKSNEYIHTMKKVITDKKELERIEKNYKYCVQNIIYEIEYINFILEIWFTDSRKRIEFDKNNLEILNINENEKLSLENQLYMFENYFGNYVKKINDEMKDNNLKSELLFEKIRKVFFDNNSKYVINFNYTNYLNEYAINSNYGLNIIKIININGDINSVVLETAVSENRKKSPKYLKTALKLAFEENVIDNDLKKMNQDSVINLIKKNKFLDEFISEKEKNDLLNRIENSTSDEFKEKISQVFQENRIDKNIEYMIKKMNEEIMSIFPFTSGLKESKIIFGIDKIQIENSEDKLKTFIKSNRRKNSESEWKLLVKEHKFTKIYFFGHSLADADYTFFEDLFDIIDITNNNIKLIFLYVKKYPCQESVKKLIGKYYINKEGKNNLSDNETIKKVEEYYIEKLKFEEKLEFKEV
ncbi:hypothetical protein [Leptotrichia massiliensis]